MRFHPWEKKKMCLNYEMSWWMMCRLKVLIMQDYLLAYDVRPYFVQGSSGIEHPIILHHTLYKTFSV